MAQLLSNGQIDFRQFNLFEVISQFDHFAFYNNAHPSVDAQELPGLIGTYSAEDLSAFWTGASNPGDAGDTGARLYIAGDAFVINANNNAVSGTVTAMSLKESYGGPAMTFDFYGFRMGAVAFQNAAMTQSNTDDLSLLRGALIGADRITGSAFADYAYGWTGNDKLYGNGGNDTLSGDAGNDYVRGGNGHDSLKGGSGADSVLGDAGNDRIYDGLGRDVLTGGAGQRLFLLHLWRHRERPRDRLCQWRGPDFLRCGCRLWPDRGQGDGRCGQYQRRGAVHAG